MGEGWGQATSRPAPALGAAPHSAPCLGTSPPGAPCPFRGHLPRPPHLSSTQVLTLLGVCQGPGHGGVSLHLPCPRQPVSPGLPLSSAPQDGRTRHQTPPGLRPSRAQRGSRGAAVPGLAHSSLPAAGLTPSSQTQVGASGQEGRLASSPGEPCKAPEISSLEGILWPSVGGCRATLAEMGYGVKGPSRSH